MDLPDTIPYALGYKVAKTNKSNNIKCWQGYETPGSPKDLGVDVSNGTTTLNNFGIFLYGITIRVYYDTAILLLFS